MEKVLILGHHGTLGSAIMASYERNLFQSQNYKLITYNDKIDDLSRLEMDLKTLNPDVIINCIAKIDSEFCENYPSVARFTNTLIPQQLAQYCESHNKRFVHISSDSALGYRQSERCESSPPDPTNVYGKSKLEGERKALISCSNTLVCRVNFFGHSPKGTSYLDYFISNAKENKTSIGYSNVIFNPISVLRVASYVKQLAHTNQSGLIHVTGSSAVTRFEFGRTVYKILKKNPNLVIPGARQNCNGKEQDMTLCTCLFRKLSKIDSDWQKQLTELIMR